MQTMLIGTADARRSLSREDLDEIRLDALFEHWQEDLSYFDDDEGDDGDE
jgi:hypothetical protein